MQVKSKAILSVVAAGIGIFAMFFGFRVRKYYSQPPPQPQSQRGELLGDPDRFGLRTISVSDEVRVHLLDGDFKIARRMNEIPNSCTRIFESSFVTNSGSHAKSGQIILANPGEAFQASDYIANPELPFRRLEFAGLSTAKCFIHYQSGGKPSSFCLAVVDLANQKTVWVGESAKAAESPDDLRRMLFQGQFRHVAWLPVC